MCRHQLGIIAGSSVQMEIIKHDCMVCTFVHIINTFQRKYLKLYMKPSGRFCGISCIFSVSFDIPWIVVKMHSKKEMNFKKYNIRFFGGIINTPNFYIKSELLD